MKRWRGAHMGGILAGLVLVVLEAASCSSKSTVGQTCSDGAAVTTCKISGTCSATKTCPDPSCGGIGGCYYANGSSMGTCCLGESSPCNTASDCCGTLNCNGHVCTATACGQSGTCIWKASDPHDGGSMCGCPGDCGSGVCGTPAGVVSGPAKTCCASPIPLGDGEACWCDSDCSAGTCFAGRCGTGTSSEAGAPEGGSEGGSCGAGTWVMTGHATGPCCLGNIMSTVTDTFTLGSDGSFSDSLGFFKSGLSGCTASQGMGCTDPSDVDTVDFANGTATCYCIDDTTNTCCPLTCTLQKM